MLWLSVRFDESLALADVAEQLAKLSVVERVDYDVKTLSTPKVLRSDLQR